MDIEIDYDALLDRLEIGTMLVGLETNRIWWVNPACCRILRLSETELLAMTWNLLVPRDDLETDLDLRRSMIDGRLSDIRMVRSFVRPDGSLVHISVTATTEVVGGELCLISQIQDVSEQQEAHRNLQMVMDNSPVSIHLVDQTGKVLSSGGANGRMCATLRIPPGTNIFEGFIEQEAALALVRGALAGQPQTQIIQTMGRYADLHMMPVLDDRGQVASVAIVATDVTDRERSYAEQATIADLARRALNSAEPGSLWRHAARVLSEHLGATVTLHELPCHEDGPHLVARAGPEPPAALIGATAAHESTRESAQNIWMDGWWVTPVPIGRPGEPTAIISVFRSTPPGHQRAERPPSVDFEPECGPLADREADFVRAVADVLGSAAIRFAMEDDIRYRALHDGLTDLPNRVALLDRLARLLGRADQSTGIVFIDLDGFKAVNDTYGHQAGDHILREVADRLRTSVRPGDVVARLAGDEFAILCEQVDSLPEIERVAHRVIARLAAPIDLDEGLVTLTASAGIAVSDEGLTDPNALLNASDVAMYAAKRAGTGRYVVHDGSAPRSDRRPKNPRRRLESIAEK
ncbi:sensor domain-containing protein [Parafrankia elaeagni]|uniref:sensor domain-containing protein n=1 Tax=Parafrankia elaeagni TaxID=222534 RepID=UPI0003709F7E|nr:sensor domain-containing diguanylate cyclase [Parafrankia elaeagni]